MSWWIYLLCHCCRRAVNVESFEEGGTYVLGGSCKARLNVTYNYGKHFPFRQLHGNTAQETRSLLEDAINKLQDDVSTNYWEPTEGNVKHTLQILHKWAVMNPDAIWEVH